MTRATLLVVMLAIAAARSAIGTRRHFRAETARDNLHRQLEFLARHRPASRTLAAINSPNNYFVTVGPDMNFYLGCSKFFFAGWNQWEVVEAGAGAPFLYGASLPVNMTGPQLVRALMDAAVAANLTVMRAFATAVDPEYATETGPGTFSEVMLRGLDYVLEQARLRGIKLILSLVDNWSNPGGIDQIVAWSGTASSRQEFFSDANCMRLYKEAVAKIIGRVNAINGRSYVTDPTIMAWNLINEPRCHNCADALQNWIVIMAAYVRSLDPYHLISIGSEGFYGKPNKARSDYANPQGPETWADEEGQDFIANNQVKEIDFATIHSWADNWLDDTAEFQTRWIKQHDIDGAQVLKKPVVLEEFGKWVKNETAATKEQRQQFYSLAYDLVVQSASTGGALKGIAFWEFFADGQVAPAAEGYGTGLYGVTPTDPVWATITAAAQKLLGLSAPDTCQHGKQANLPPVNMCETTWVNGRPGTGYEGPACNIDINECVRGTAACAANAACINDVGGYRCQCYWGYKGDGTAVCEAGPEVAQLAVAYHTEGPSRLACPEGADVAYPPTAPGWIDDPTGSARKQRGFGSITPVTAQDCQIACEAAPGCDAFSYNPVQRQCYLKNAASRTTCQSQDIKCVSANQNLVKQTFSCGSWQTYYRVAGPVRPQITQGALTASAG